MFFELFWVLVSFKNETVLDVKLYAFNGYFISGQRKKEAETEHNRQRVMAILIK